MKKNIMGLILTAVFAVTACAADLRDFSVFLGGAPSVDAGTIVAITITAYGVDGGIKTDYDKIVGISSSVGEIVIQETGNTLTQAFTSGMWTGFIQLRASALPLNLICADVSGATGTVSKIVSPYDYSKLLIIMDGMTWAPGTVLGFTGWPVTPTTTMPLYVTILAVDMWNNTINSGFPTDVRLAASSSSEAITPTSVDMASNSKASAVFGMTLYPNPDSSQGYVIFARDLTDSQYDTILNVFFSSLTDFFVWAEGPGSAVAGQDFTVSVKVSHLLGDVPVSGCPGTVQITGVDFGGALLNPELIYVSESSGPFPNGTKDFIVRYLQSSANDNTGIKISPAYIGTKIITNAGLPSMLSGYITIYAAAPASFDFNADKIKLKRNENSVLSVKLQDQYLNPVSNTAVDFTMLSGTGVLKDSLGNTSAVRSVNTNIYGYACITVTAMSNTITTVSASVAGIAAAQTKTIEFADIIEKEQVRNYPNPFNPSQGPTTIEYYLEEDADVTMYLYSFSGALVWKKAIPLGTIPGGKKGYNPYSWNGMTDRNMSIAAGLYTLKIEVKAPAGKYTLTRKIAVKK